MTFEASVTLNRIYLCRATFTCVLCLQLAPAANRAEGMNPAQAKLGPRIQQSLKALGADVEASLWIGDAKGQPWFEYESQVVRPTASSIKTFYLVELFAKYADQLDDPLPGIDSLLDDAHPGISHFTPRQRRDIRRELRLATVREVGKLMMGSQNTSNHVYNAAANVTTAVLGGPKELTRLIHSRDAAFRKVEVNRYMLRDRTETGDNVADPLALATLYQKLSTKKLAKIDDDLHHEIVAALPMWSNKDFGKGYSKEGSLTSDPLTRVDAGWVETSQGPIIYVVMLEQPNPGKRDRDVAASDLKKLCGELRNMLLKSMSLENRSDKSAEQTSAS